MSTKEIEAVKFANAAFYEAFRAGDADAIRATWGVEAQLSCIHPGSGILTGPDVYDSWKMVVQRGGIPIFEADVTVMLHGPQAVVSCFEIIGDTIMAATNVFSRDEAGAWKMVHHHAAQTIAAPSTIPTDVRSVQ